LWAISLLSNRQIRLVISNIVGPTHRVNKGRVGWQGLMPIFVGEDPKEIRKKLHDFIIDAGASQDRAWRDSIRILQKEFHILGSRLDTSEFGTLLEYELPREWGRRPDVIVLQNGVVVVIEFKGKPSPDLVDIDQAAAYARDLRHYHEGCQGRQVIPILVPTRMVEGEYKVDGVYIVPPKDLPKLLELFSNLSDDLPINSREFISADWEPMPSLVEAARVLWETNELPRIRRAHACTDPTLQAARKIIRNARDTKSRRLILISGVPGAGKTLVGLRLAYDSTLTELASPRRDGSRPSTTSVLLSGNGPLVEVLRYALKSGVFVQGIKPYITNHCAPGNEHRIPREHVVIFDEAQRAWDHEKVASKHPELRGSEPDLLVETSERVPEWSVFIGLIGTGQAIHEGEEGGISQWARALSAAPNPDSWKVHCPANLSKYFEVEGIDVEKSQSLSLDVTLRSHFAESLHEYIDGVLLNSDNDVNELKKHSQSLKDEGFRMYISRDLDLAKQHVKTRYKSMPDARFGIIASSKDKVLSDWNVPNDWNTNRRMKVGAWFNEGEDNDRSCRTLTECATEFQCQGLELDMTIVGWGTDFIRNDGTWSNIFSRGYRRQPVDKFALRKNSYRVLLTRARDGMILFIPPIDQLDETYDYLQSVGFSVLE